CEKLTSLQSIEKLTQLQQLDLTGCEKLTSLRGIEKLTQLQQLDLSRCDNLTSLQGIEKLTQLQQLDLSRCDNLTSLKGIENLSQLQQLSLRFSKNLTSLKGIEKLTQLQQLDLTGCENLTSLQGIENLSQLQQLDLSRCDNLTSLKGIENLSQLQQLSLRFSKNLTSLKGIEKLTQLKQLDLTGCNNLTSLQGLEKLPQLQQLDLSRCDNLTSLQGIENLTQLKRLDVDDGQIKDLEPLRPIIHQLDELYLHGNPLEEIYGIQLALFENNLDTIKNLLARLDDEHITLKLPAKVLFLGNHAAGKSSLVHYLTHHELPNESDSTHILNIQPYQLPDAEPEKNKAKVQLPSALFYDFGGQDYYHGIYRVFVSRLAVTCLLWHRGCNCNELAEDSNQLTTRHFCLDYWLGYWQYNQPKPTFTEEEQPTPAPLLLVQTHADECTAPEHQQETPALNQHFVGLNPQKNSTLNQHSLRYFRAQLDTLVKAHTKTVPGPKWYQGFLGKVLEQHSKTNHRQHLPVEVKSWIKYYHPDIKSLDNLKAEFSQLHLQGLVLYYPNIDPETVWLNPIGFARYVHEKVLNKNAIKHHQGRVPVNTFKDFHPNILKVLEAEKVLFLHRHNPDGEEYIVPNYLPLAGAQNADYQLLTLGLADSLAFSLWFRRYLPLGLINQLICHFGDLPDMKKFWRNQLLFTLGHGSTDRVASKVLIQLIFGEQLKVQVYLSQPNPATRLEHLQYIYYVMLGLYHDAPVTGLKTFIQGFNAFKALPPERQQPDTGELMIQSLKRYAKRFEFFEESEEDLGALLGSEEKTLAASFEQQIHTLQKVYLTPPKDLYLSLDGEAYISATALTNAEHHQPRLPVVRIEPAAQHQPEHTAITPFAPFTHRRLSQVKKVFISYSHEDIQHRQTLQTYLINLERDGLIEIWQDGLINPGDDWHKTITDALAEADIVIMLVSQSFIASSYVHGVEMPMALTRKAEGQADIFPVLISQCDFQHWNVIPEEARNNQTAATPTPMGRFQFFPMDDENQRLKPINRWEYPEDAWTQLANKLRKMTQPKS
ncbi:leucine-rich repeat domain-containing protein, partial [Vibrio aerogenes]